MRDGFQGPLLGEVPCDLLQGENLRWMRRRDGKHLAQQRRPAHLLQGQQVPANRRLHNRVPYMRLPSDGIVPQRDGPRIPAPGHPLHGRVIGRNPRQLGKVPWPPMRENQPLEPSSHGFARVGPEPERRGTAGHDVERKPRPLQFVVPGLEPRGPAWQVLHLVEEQYRRSGTLAGEGRRAFPDGLAPMGQDGLRRVGRGIHRPVWPTGCDLEEQGGLAHLTRPHEQLNPAGGRLP